MSIIIEEVNPKKLKPFIKFPFELYKGNPYYVPPIIDFELSTLSPKKNPAFSHAKAKYWLAKMDGKTVGRIAGIILDMEAEEKGLMRIGWVDFIDDPEVSKALFETAIEWGKTFGIKGVHGPMGFTDLDFEGLLIEGFDQLASQAAIYNYPYYKDHFERFGFEKACDWVEVHGTLPPMPKRLQRTAEIVSSRFKLTSKKFKKTKDLLPFGKGVFDVLNESYKDLYGYYPLTDQQIDYYIKLYFGFIRKEFVSIIVNEKDEVVAFAISLPSLSKAFQKAKGHLYPFGFISVLKAFYSNQHLDMFLIGVKPAYQKMGANAVIFHDILNVYTQKGVNYVSTGPMLENNRGVLNLWNDYQDHLKEVVRRRCFIKRMNQ